MNWNWNWSPIDRMAFLLAYVKCTWMQNMNLS